MRKKEKLVALLLTSVISAVLASAALVSCYQDVEVDTSEPGSLLPLAGVYNARDVGGYATFYDMARGRALSAFNDAYKAYQQDNSKVSALRTAFNALQSGYPELDLTEIAIDYSNMKDALEGLKSGLAKDGTEKASEKGIQARHVKKGYIIRSGDLSLLTPADIKYLQDFGVQAVIDFRGIYPMSGGRGTEQGGDVDRLNFADHGILAGRDEDPHPITNGKIGYVISVVYGEYPRLDTHIGKTVGAEGIVIDDYVVKVDGTYIPRFGDRFAIEEGVVGSMDRFLGVDNSAVKTKAQMIKGYQSIIKNEANLTADTHSFGGSYPYEGSGAVQYHNFFMYLIYEDGDEGGGISGTMRTSPAKLIFHCSAGKDRTGMAAALFYSALGVPRETIINDYMLSAKYVAEKYYPVIYTLGEQMEPLVSVKREYIESFFEHIDSTFLVGGANVYPNVSYDKSASVISFLTREINKETDKGGLGLTLPEIYHLRKLYLE